VGEPSGARRIPEEGAQRPTKLYWVLGAVLIANLSSRAPNARRARRGHFNLIAHPYPLTL